MPPAFSGCSLLFRRQEISRNRLGDLLLILLVVTLSVVGRKMYLTNSNFVCKSYTKTLSMALSITNA